MTKKEEPKEKIELNFKEFCLIHALRNKFGHGEVVLLMRDFKIQRIKQAWISDELETPHLTKKKE